MDELPPPGGSEDSLIRADDERAIVLYRATHPEWAGRVTAGQFLAAHPSLAGQLHPEPLAPDRNPAATLLRFTLPLTVFALIATLLFTRDWKIAQLFFRTTPGEDPARTLTVRPLAQSAPPAASAPFIRALNETLSASPLNWTTVLENAAALRGEAAALQAVRATPATYAWLHEVEAMAHLHLAEREPHRTGHWDAVVRLEREFGPAELARPFPLAFGACVARFEQAGGSRDLFLGQPSAVPPDVLLDAVAALRQRYPAELAKSPEQPRQLARVECYTLLRRIAPRKVRWLAYTPFDENDPANRETWTQLAQAMERWKKLEGDKPSSDLDQLQRVFWQAVERFCKWPTRWKDASVTIGNYDYRRADARAALAGIEARRTGP